MTMTEQSPDLQTHWARIIVACLLSLFGLWIISGFLPALVWAVVIAVAIDPLHVRLRNRWPTKSGHVLIAALITTGIALLVLVPLAAGLTRAVTEAQAVGSWVNAARLNGVPIPAWLQDLPFGSEMVTGWWQDNLASPEAAALQLHHLAGADLVTHTRLIGSNVLHRTVIFAFTLLTLFFLLRDRDAIIAQGLRAGDRLLGPAGERIGRQAILSVRGTIDGLVLVGIGEGAVMTLVYILVGVQHPLLFGMATAVAAMIPFGAALIFALVCLLLLGHSAVTGAIAVMSVGLTVVGIADHFIRPALIGGATRLPFLWVLIGILGGVETLGLLGLFVGPATIAVLIMLWREFLETPASAA